jgi:hypothetical protein
MTRYLFGIIVATVMLAASPALASISYLYGGTPFSDGSTATSATYDTTAEAYADFTSRYANIVTEDFEGFGSLVNQSNSLLNVAMGTITSGSAGYVGSATTNQANFNEGPLGNTGYYFSNGTPNADSPKGSFSLNLDRDYRSIGFYVSDWNDISGSQIYLNISGVDGTGAAWTETVDIRSMLGSLNSGTMVFFSLFSDLAFNTVTFNTSNNDGYGIDNISVGSPTPIPGAIWLLGSGLIGLVGIRRRFA